MNFIATRHAADGDYAETFEAASWAAATEHCRKKLWRLDGELKAELPVWLPIGIAFPIVKLFFWMKEQLEKGT